MDSPMPLPEDPFPDLTLVTIPGAVIRNGLGQLVQLVPERVAAAEVLMRGVDGEPVSVRIV